MTEELKQEFGIEDKSLTKLKISIYRVPSSEISASCSKYFSS